VTVLFFHDWPVDGVLSAFTLGVALGSHVEELGGHPELVISLRTTDRRWGEGVGYLSEEARDQAVLGVGATLDIREPISAESPMTGFILTHPHHRGGETIRFRVADRDVVILEAHPILPSELVAGRQGGREELVRCLFGARYDVNRQAVSIATTFSDSGGTNEEGERFVECYRHGRSQPAFVCRHLVAQSREQVPKPIGFFQAKFDPDNRRWDDLNAWCRACDDMLIAEGEWSERSTELAGITLVCAGCFSDMRAEQARFQGKSREASRRFRCRICDFESSDSTFCTICLADTMRPA
jgi:hypothetical protein